MTTSMKCGNIPELELVMLPVKQQCLLCPIIVRYVSLLWPSVHRVSGAIFRQSSTALTPGANNSNRDRNSWTRLLFSRRAPFGYAQDRIVRWTTEPECAEGWELPSGGKEGICSLFKRARKHGRMTNTAGSFFTFGFLPPKH